MFSQPVVPVLPLHTQVPERGGRLDGVAQATVRRRWTLRRPDAGALERVTAGARDIPDLEGYASGDVINDPGWTSRTLRGLRELCSGGKFARQYARGFLSLGEQPARIALALHHFLLAALLVGGAIATIYYRSWEAGAGTVVSIATFGNIVADICDELHAALSD